MSITQTVDIPVSHRLVIDVPREIPAGSAVVTLDFKPVTAGDCPLCAVYKEPNEETIAAIEEGRAMLRGEKPATWFSSAEEMWANVRAELRK